MLLWQVDSPTQGKKEMHTREYHRTNLRDFTFAVDAMLREALDDIIETEHWSLDDYLAELDKGTYECEAVGDVTIKFHPDHRVTASFDLNEETSLIWKFTEPITVEVGAVFENLLD